MAGQISQGKELGNDCGPKVGKEERQLLLNSYVLSTRPGTIATGEVLAHLTDEAMEAHMVESLAEAYMSDMW